MSGVFFLTPPEDHELLEAAAVEVQHVPLQHHAGVGGADYLRDDWRNPDTTGFLRVSPGGYGEPV